MITLVLADDHPTIRAGLRAILSETPDIQIVGEAQDGIEVKKIVEQLRPQILLLNLRMPGPRPAEVEKWVRTHCPETETLILTGLDRDFYLAEMMDAGVAGYLTKNETSERLIDSVRRAAQGYKVFTEEQYARVLKWHEAAGDKWESLTEREREIIKFVVKGLDNAEIAQALDVTSKTVAFHISNILDKLDVHSRQEAMAWVHRYLSDILEELPG